MIDVSGGSPVETWAHADRLGSVIATTDGAGAVADKYRYSPYGKPGAEGAGGFQFRYTGQKLDPETGLYYYKARYYDPDTGRFLQVDPTGYEDQMNLYAYVGNDSLNCNDLMGEAANAAALGLCAVGPIGCGAGVVIALAPLAGLAAVAVYNEVTDGDSPRPVRGTGVRPTDEPVDLPEQLAGEEILGELSDGGGENISEGMGDDRYNP